MIARGRVILIGRWLLLGVLTGLCVWGVVRMVNTTWFERIGDPVSGSFSAGPINQFFSAGQTLAPGDAEVARIDLKLSHAGPYEGTRAFVEVRDAPAGQSLRSGPVRLVRGEAWYAFTFPPISTAESGGALFVEVRSLAGSILSDRDRLSVLYEQRDPYAAGRMYVRGQPARPDWDLAFRMYRAVGPREALRVVGGWAIVAREAPWLTGMGVVLAAGASGWLAWRGGRRPYLPWTLLLVVLALLALAVHLPEAVANPAIDTATVELH